MFAKAVEGNSEHINFFLIQKASCNMYVMWSTYMNKKLCYHMHNVCLNYLNKV